MKVNNLITEIELLDGSVVPINSRISIQDFTRAQKEGLLNKGFLNNMLKRQGASGVNAEDYLNAAFVCYRAAGGKLAAEEFKSICPFDLELLGTIFGQMMTGGKPVEKTKFQASLEAATKK